MYMQFKNQLRTLTYAVRLTVYFCITLVLYIVQNKQIIIKFHKNKLYHFQREQNIIFLMVITF